MIRVLIDVLGSGVHVLNGPVLSNRFTLTEHLNTDGALAI